MDSINILIVGVGGQGSLLASRILGAFFMRTGQDVKVSEVHGMSQRGGSVVTYVRTGENVAMPVVPDGEADLVIAFEGLEALRWAPQLKPGGKLIYSAARINPLPVTVGAAAYPDGIPDKLNRMCAGAVSVDAPALAEQAGSVKAANIVMLGAASIHIGGETADWQAALREVIPAKILDMNLAAFDLGRKAIS